MSFDPKFTTPTRTINIEGDNSVFRLQLHSFKILTKTSRNWPGKKLRFTLTWRLDVPHTSPDGVTHIEELGQDQEGCLARVSKFGELIWSPPKARSGTYYANVIFNSPDLYERIKRALERTKYFNLLKMPIVQTAFSPGEIDLELPLELEG